MITIQSHVLLKVVSITANTWASHLGMAVLDELLIVIFMKMKKLMSLFKIWKRILV